MLDFGKCGISFVFYFKTINIKGTEIALTICEDIWNFDETGFRIGCPKGEEIYVPLDVKEVSYYLRNKG